MMIYSRKFNILRIGRLIAVFLFTIVATNYLIGCEDEKELNEEKVTITFMHGWGGNLKNHQTMQKIYDEFNYQNEDIEVIYRPFPDVKIAVEEANDMLAVGKMADIISTNGFSYYEENSVKKGMALDLMPYILNDEEFKSQISGDVFDAWDRNGGLYTIPDAIEVIGYWYNKEIFKNAGVVDENGEVLIPRTWEAFFKACDKIKSWSEKENNGVIVAALESNQIVENFFFARLAGMGDEGIEIVNTIPDDFSGELMEKAVEDIGKLYNYSEKVNNIDNARQYFKDGKSAIYFNGIWDCNYFAGEDIEDSIGYTAYPSETRQTVAYVSPSSGYVIRNNIDSNKREACVKFLKYMLSDEVQTEIALNTGQAPSSPRVDNEKIKEQYKLLGEGIDIAINADIRIKSMRSVWSGAYGDILTTYLPEAYESKEKYLEMIQKMNRARESY